MTSVEPDVDAVRQALEHAGELAAGLVRRGAPLDGPVPGLQWTKAQLVAHLCAMCEAFASTLRGEDFVERFGTEFVGSYGSGPTLRDAVAATNAKVVKDAACPTPAAAADALTSGAAALLAAFNSHRDLSAQRPAPWYGPEVALPVGSLLSLAVSELLVHGYDLARAVGADLRPSPAAAASATAVAAAVMSEMLPRILDERAASGFTGSFEIRVRGGERFVLRIADGRAWSEPAGSLAVDCVLTLSAYHALLMGYDRVPAWRVIASGKAWAFGRRPWLGLRFDQLFLTV
ncbi:MAG TPA: maleylpyruvate isomerase N-terminal domain-containing protein [Streptosporangiaceae bacterium]|nr:maleylpyruvate isomerase N-terminal domain-containing protein [Streptosporangiaceae bacterium]